MEEETKVVEQPVAPTEATPAEVPAAPAATPAPAAPEAPVGNATKSKKPIVITLIVLLVLAVGAVGGYFIYKKVRLSNPVSITTDLITKMQKSSKKLAKDKVFQTIVNTEPTNYKIEASVAGMASLNFGLGMDLKNDLIALSVDATAQGSSLLKLIGQVDKEGILIVPSDQSKNAYSFSYDTKEIFASIRKYVDFANKNSADKVYNYLKDSFAENYKEEYFTKSGNTYTTVLTPERIKPVVSGFVNKLKNDKEFLSSFVDLYNMISPEETIDEKTINETLDELVTAITESAAEAKFTYSITVDGVSKVTYQFKIEEDKEVGTITYVTDGDDEEVTLVNKENDKVLTNIKYVNNDKEFSLTADESSFVYNRKEETFVFKANGEEVVSGILKIDESKGKVVFDITLTVEGANVNVKITAENVDAKDLIKVDTSKYSKLDLDNATNQQAFMTELQSNPIFELLGGLIESSDWDSVDGYDDDDWDDWEDDDDDWDWEDEEEDEDFGF